MSTECMILKKVYPRTFRIACQLKSHLTGVMGHSLDSLTLSSLLGGFFFLGDEVIFGTQQWYEVNSILYVEWKPEDVLQVRHFGCCGYGLVVISYTWVLCGTKVLSSQGLGCLNMFLHWLYTWRTWQCIQTWDLLP